MVSPPRIRIVIIGAGIGGLTLALLLRRRGIDAEILEQASELDEVGAGIALASNATRVLQWLGLGDDLARLSTEPTALIHRDGRNGHLISVHPMGEWYRRTFGAPFVGLHRMALQQLLADAWGPDHLHLGRRVEAREQRGESIRVRCATGEVFDSDLVVGADGVHSVVRRWITGGAEAVYSRTSGFRGLVPVGQLPGLPDLGALQFWVGPGAHLLHYPIADGSLINFLAALRRYEDRRQVRTRQVQAASWAASAALHLPDGSAVPPATSTWLSCPSAWPGFTATTSWLTSCSRKRDERRDRHRDGRQAG